MTAKSLNRDKTPLEIVCIQERLQTGTNATDRQDMLRRDPDVDKLWGNKDFSKAVPTKRGSMSRKLTLVPNIFWEETTISLNYDLPRLFGDST